MSYVSSYYHIVINTYNRAANIPLLHSDLLYCYISSIIKNKKSTLIAINGTRNHIHMLINLHPTQNLSDVMRELKQGSSRWMKHDPRFSKFGGWGKDYFAFSCSRSHTDAVVRYIKNQREHHRVIPFEHEIKSIAIKNGSEWSDYMLT